MKYLLATLAVFLTACAQPRPAAYEAPVLTTEEREALNHPLECEGRDQCQFLWRRIQAWVATNAGYKIQTATDAVVETFGASRYSSTWAIRVLRVPMSPDRDRFQFAASCGDTARCRETIGKLEARFLLAMRRQ